MVLSGSSCYLVSQGYHLAEQQLSARPIAKIDRATLSAEERELFTRVERIREYAREELGLTVGKSYTTYYATSRTYLVDVVSAAAEFSFERKEWRYPFFGSFPYQGFFRPEGARRLAMRLKDEGWDVIVRKVEGFSTLGILRDPLTSYMAAYSESRLSELVIHEMAHATVWVKGEAQFNEEFATFVGRTGSRDFLVARYGADSPRIISLDASREDALRFVGDMLALKRELEDLYATFHGDDIERWRGEKSSLITDFQARFRDQYARNYRTERYLPFAERTINNAFLDLYETYSGNRDRFQVFYRDRAASDLAVMIAEIKSRASRWSKLPRRRRLPVIEILSPSLPG